MSGTPPTREEDFDLYALGALDGDEKAAFEAPLASCASCKMKLAEATGRMAMLALAAPPASPSPGVKERLMRQVLATGRGPIETAAGVAPGKEGGFARGGGLLLPGGGGF